MDSAIVVAGDEPPEPTSNSSIVMSAAASLSWSLRAAMLEKVVLGSRCISLITEPIRRSMCPP